MSSGLDKAVKDIIQTFREAGKNKPAPFDTQAEVIRVDGDTAWVHIPGGVDETPVKLTISAKVGDKIQVHIGGGRAWITGNATAPPTDDRQANIATEKAETVEKKVSVVQKIADTARKIAGDTTQYFWHTQEGTDTGAHITEKPQEEFLADPANGGGNLLARSNGIAVRDGLTELATFGASGAQVGKSAGMHLNLDSDGMKVGNGNTTITSINAEMYQGHTHTVIGLTGDTTSEDSGYNEAILIGDLSHTQGSTNDGALVVRSFDPNESEHVSTSVVQVTATKNQGYIQLITDAGSEDTAYLWLRHINTTSEKYSEIQARAGSFTLQPQYDNEGSQTGTAFKIANGSNKYFTVDWNGNIVASGNLSVAGHYTSAITACGATGTADLALTKDEQKVNLNSNRARVGSDLISNDGGVQCAKSGYVEVSGAIYCTTGFTANDYVHLVIRRGSTLIINAVHRIPNDYDYYSVAPIVYSVSAGDILYLYAYNQSGARGQISAATGSWLTVKYL